MFDIPLIFAYLKSLVWCNHEWEHVRHTTDFDLSCGFEHVSEIYKCSKCGKYEIRPEGE